MDDKQRKVSNKTTMIKEVTTNWVKNEYVEDETALIFIES